MKQLAIIGPTASGKTSLALCLAKSLNAVILSLDSLCIYTQINIASAKPNEKELKSIKHFGINIRNVDESFNAADFAKQYQKACAYAKQNGKNLIITGGSGFYLASMLNGLAPKTPKLKTHPANDEIFTLASKIDPEFCAKFSKNDTFRLQKWYEIFSFLMLENNEISKQNLKSQNTEILNFNESLQNKNLLAPSIWLAKNTAAPLIKKLCIFELTWGRDELRARIFARTKQMLDDGLLNEAQTLFNSYNKELKALKSIGLKECGEFLSGEIKSQNELYELISTHTAQLAKRQRTFFNSNFKNSIKINANEAYEKILNYFNEI